MDESGAGVVEATGDVPVSPIALDADFLAAIGPGLARVQRIARVLTGDADLAEDVVAEAIAKSLPHWRAGRVDDVPAYLRRAVVNLASRQWRRRALGRRRDHAALDWVMPTSDTEHVTTERDRTLRAVVRLPVRRRAVVVLRFYDDLSEQQIADVLGIRIGTVKSQLSRALEQLRGDLGDLEGR